MKRRWSDYIGITLIMVIFWVAVSGTLKWPQLLFGFSAAIFVVWFNRSLLFKPYERVPFSLKTTLWISGYFLKLLADIVVANFQVAWLVLHPKMPIEPNLIDLEVDIEKVTGRVLLANSITLTPGTLTVMAEENKFIVHALTYNSGDNLKDWPLIRKIRDLEKEA